MLTPAETSRLEKYAMLGSCIMIGETLMLYDLECGLRIRPISIILDLVAHKYVSQWTASLLDCQVCYSF